MPQKTKRPPPKIETAMKSIIPCLWFDGQAEEAARFYVSLFPDSHVDKVVEAPADFPSGKRGDVLSVDFTLMGRKFSGLNGGPYFKFNERSEERRVGKECRFGRWWWPCSEWR